jgi:hypothetical protein
MVKWVLESLTGSQVPHGFLSLHTIYQQKRVHDNKDEENLMMAHKLCAEVLLVKLERKKCAQKLSNKLWSWKIETEREKERCTRR